MVLGQKIYRILLKHLFTIIMPSSTAIQLGITITFPPYVFKLLNDIFRSFHCLNQQNLKSLIEIFEKIDFEHLDLNILSDIAKIIKKLF